MIEQEEHTTVAKLETQLRALLPPLVESGRQLASFLILTRDDTQCFVQVHAFGLPPEPTALLVDVPTGTGPNVALAGPMAAFGPEHEMELDTEGGNSVWAPWERDFPQKVGATDTEGAARLLLELVRKVLGCADDTALTLFSLTETGLFPAPSSG